MKQVPANQIYEQIYRDYKQQGENQAAQEQMQSAATDGKESIVAVRKNDVGDHCDCTCGHSWTAH